MLNAVYALLAERADDADRLEQTIKPHVNDETAKKLCRNREELDDWLATPYGDAAEDEKALVAYLTA